MAEKTIALKDGEGRSFWVMNGLYTVKAATEETGGALAVIEFTVPAGWGPPTHTHNGSESVLVLEGRILFHIDGETVEGGPGSFFHIPEGVWERFEPLETTRLLITYAPGGGIDEFFAEVGEPATSHELPPVTEPDVAKIVEAAARYGMQMRP
ncbi:cupin domain-containing protein [Streptomyces sp. NPDC059443]|uniref:cupin domain-containing protein n=1 Tax=unclassified Streptomyces TaxID=2593676 RepID=UPI0036876F23